MTSQDAPFLFGAVVGSGMTAQVADRAGADYLLALNAGRFRVQGASSLACFLPIRRANEWVFEFAEREILGRVKAPVFAGLSVSDPGLDLGRLVAKTRALGFSGICNFPSNSLVGGRVHDLLEAEGLGFSREIDLMRAARGEGLDALVYVTTNDQAHAMYDAGATTICVNMGFTGGPTGISSEFSLSTAAQAVDEVLDGLPASFPTLCAGGPIISPEDAMTVWRSSKVNGYISGSSLDRFPIEQTLEEVASGFRVISQLSRGHRKAAGADALLVGSSAAIQAINRDIKEMAADREPVLILGETGTGKSTVARLLHKLSTRRNQRLAVIDCPGLEPESGRVQLMGTAGTVGNTMKANTRGALEAAARGTVIFENVEALMPEHQGQILRFAEDGTVQRLGDIDGRGLSVRVLSTAVPDLLEAVAAQTYRSDLYYRLSVHQIRIPPLRDRIEDISELVDFFAAQIDEAADVKFTNSALKMLMDYPWPGNVRELQNVVRRAIFRAKSPTIGRNQIEFLDLPTIPPPPVRPTPVSHDSPTTERDWIATALARHGWRRAQAAKDLGMSTRTLFNKIKKYNLDE